MMTSERLRKLSEFSPKYEYENTPLLLRDNSPDKNTLKMIESNPSWRDAWGLFHIVVGYNPSDNGSEMNRGCGNACPSCYFDEEYLQTNPSHILGVTKTSPGQLSNGLSSFMKEVQVRAEQRIGAKIADADKRIRISGNVRGDPVMADYETTRKMAGQIKNLFPDIPLFIDTQANQYVVSPDKWRALEVDRIMVSIDAANRNAYMISHGVGKGRFEVMLQNIHNIDSAGKRLGFSYVWGDHPRLTDEQREAMPHYIKDGQDDLARKEFVQSLELSQVPIERLWLFSIRDDAHLRQIQQGDERYARLLMQKR